MKNIKLHTDRRAGQRPRRAGQRPRRAGNNENSKHSFRREFSAGGVVFKKFKIRSPKLKIKWLIGKHSGYNKWVLPKGLIEKGERGHETAVREVREEMGVRARLVEEKPIHGEQYWYVADFKEKQGKRDERKVKIIDYRQSDEARPSKRVEKYQESGGRKTKVFKVVSFYLMEYVSGDPKDHDWEMSEAGWFSLEEALEKLAFAGEKRALEKANAIILENSELRN